MLRLVAIGVGIVAAAIVVAFVLSSWSVRPESGAAGVPNLVGLSLERATVAAENAGFELAAPVYLRRDDQPEGTVVVQDPPAGTVADRGSEILVFVSTGRQLVPVPDVVGDTEAQAIATLSGAGLSVRRTATLYDAAVPAGTVIATDPVAGTSVAAGTAVGYAVSGGPEPSSPLRGPAIRPRRGQRHPATAGHSGSSIPDARRHADGALSVTPPRPADAHQPTHLRRGRPPPPVP
jgi:serine/threonine-protein kinase